MVFRAKVDSSTIIYKILSPILLIFVSSMRLNLTKGEVVVALCIFYSLMTLIVVVNFSTKYILTEQELIVSRPGVTRKISYESIDKIECKTKYPSMDAPSSEQVCLMKQGKIVVAVSPKEKQDFVTRINGYLNQSKGSSGR